MSRLKAHNREAAGTAATEGGKFKKVDELANGEYHCQIAAAELKELDIGDVLAIKIYVNVTPTEAVTIDWDTWLSNVESGIVTIKHPAIGYMRSQLRSLGIEESAWEPDLFFDRLEQALPFLRGMQFQCRKTSKPGDNGKVFHNLYVKSRHSDSQPAKVTLAMLGEVTPQGLNYNSSPTPTPPVSPPANSNDDIPF